MFIAKLFVYICEMSYPLNSYHIMHMCQQLQQTTTATETTKTTTNRSETIYPMEKHVFFNTQINTYGCVHNCVCVCVSLSHIFLFHHYTV